MSKPKSGNFFPAVLPLLMAAADRENRRARPGAAAGETLRALFAKIRESRALRHHPAGHTPVFRTLEGILDLDPASFPDRDVDAALAASGGADASAGTRRALLLTGDDHGPLSGIVAYLDENGALAASAPLQAADPAATTAAFLTQLAAGQPSPLRWTSPSQPARRATAPTFQHLFGIE